MDPARLDPLPPPSDAPSDEAVAEPQSASWTPRPKFQDRVWLHILLFVLTIATTTLTGVEHYLGYVSNFLPIATPGLTPRLLLTGLWYSGTILAILGCHELGHYFACRYYDVDASRPFFIPFLSLTGTPILSLTGTLGAFIRIREPIPAKRMLFDIGIAGPIAGFLVAVPMLFIGVSMSRVVRLPPNFVGIELGEPLLFKAASWLVWGSTPDGYSVNLHPIAFAAWIGLFATALNLFPFGQLDGGHISYAVLGRRSTYVTYAMLVVAVVLSLLYISWIVWTGLMILMLFVVGPRHPRVFDEHVPLDRTRIVLAFFALVMFVLCFTPAPFQPTDLLRR